MQDIIIRFNEHRRECKHTFDEMQNRIMLIRLRFKHTKAGIVVVHLRREKHYRVQKAHNH